ncbi:hypothetical protein OSK46_10590, partial [Escherichia coli]|nr:hypothetical protein [Escherichia coli]
MNNSIPERFIFQCALFKNLEREVFMTHGYVDSHIIDQALRLRGFAPIFPDICYHLTHYKPAAADIPV